MVLVELLLYQIHHQLLLVTAVTVVTAVVVVEQVQLQILVAAQVVLAATALFIFITRRKKWLHLQY
jgi:hypothetical protein